MEIPDSYASMSYFNFTDWDEQAFPRMVNMLDTIDQCEGDSGISLAWERGGIVARISCRDGCWPSNEQIDVIQCLRQVQAQVGQMYCVEVDVL